MDGVGDLENFRVSLLTANQKLLRSRRRNFDLIFNERSELRYSRYEKADVRKKFDVQAGDEQFEIFLKSTRGLSLLVPLVQLGAYSLNLSGDKLTATGLVALPADTPRSRGLAHSGARADRRPCQ